MRRNPEIMRLLLTQQRDEIEPEELKSFPESDVVYNASLLINDGFVEGDSVRDHNGKVVGTVILSLTSKGHDLLEKLETTSVNPKIPTEIAESLSKFKVDHPNPERVGFVMMRFSDTPIHKSIIDMARAGAGAYSIELLRADDKEYHSDLFYNILTYIYGCGFGVAVFERIEQDEFNPNVSFEVGYMMALNKHVLLLKDKNLKVLHTDLTSKLYRPFDPLQVGQTVPGQITQWMRDKGLA